MRTLFSFFTLLLLMMGGTSCEDTDSTTTTADERVDVTLTFRGTFGDQPLRMYDQEYAYADNMNLRFQLFQFYVSNVQLYGAEKNIPDTVSLIDIDLISFKDVIAQADAERGVQITIPDVPTGTYDGIRLGLGVAPEYNATQPGDYTPPHPLDDHYWSWARGYVFTKVEGNVDYDRDGTYDEKLTFHLGENPFYRTLNIAEPVIVGPNNQDIIFEVDLRRVLQVPQGDYVDFRTVTQDHTNDMELVGFMSDNLRSAVLLTE